MQTTQLRLLLLVVAVSAAATAQKPLRAARSPVTDVRIECNSNEIVVSISTSNVFNGMIYPKGLSKNSSCMTEYTSSTGSGSGSVQYRLPLRSCNTMSLEEDQDIEYFNTIVVQPHRKLVTNQGRGYHIRCKYQTREKAVNTNFNVSQLGTTPLTATAPMPSCTMRIYSNSVDKTVAENVKIGDPLILDIAIDEQDIYGLKAVDCIVRDGLGWGEQPLINSEGCPVDYEIMGPFNYSESKTSAKVNFQAHKFPYTASVYYQCNVRLCLKHTGGCDDVPPECADGTNLRRRRRRAAENATVTDLETDEEPVIEVFSGLYVNEGEEVPEDDPNGPLSRDERDEDDILCISPRTFAIAIAIVGLLLMIAVVVAIMVIISRRRRRKEASAAGSSIYSGPYTNTAYSHSS